MASNPKSESTQVADEVTLKYVEILKKNGIVEPVSEVIVKDAGLVGEGFVSQTLYVTVKFQNPEVPVLNLFAKVHTCNPSHVEMITELKAFEKEARFFMEYIPAATELCMEKGQLELLDIYPKCYYGDEKLIVMENLVLDKGYVLHPKEERQGLEEAKAALLSLATHHAISYAMIQKHGGGDDFLKTFKHFGYDPFTTSYYKTMMGPWIINAANNNTKLIQKYNVVGSDVAVKRIKSIGEKAIDKIAKSLEINSNDNFFVLNHGDYHTNNMMFLKDSKTKKILHHKAIDLQVVRYNSPGIDLSYFLFTSVKQEVRRKHLEELLSFYLTSFKRLCEDLGHIIELSYEDLYYEIRKKFYHSFWFGFTMIGPGMAFMKDVNMSELGDMSEFAVLVDKAIQKWVEDNPEQCEGVAKEIVGFVEEYYELRLD